MCIACGVLLFRRTKAYNMRAENISLELNQVSTKICSSKDIGMTALFNSHLCVISITLHFFLQEKVKVLRFL